jgi:hypothetical protein
MSMLEREYPHQVHLDKGRYHLIGEIKQWCLEHIGTGGFIQGGTWCVFTAFGKSSWCFKNQEDAALFTLRWI